MEGGEDLREKVSRLTTAVEEDRAMLISIQEAWDVQQYANMMANLGLFQEPQPAPELPLDFAAEISTQAMEIEVGWAFQTVPGM